MTGIKLERKEPSDKAKKLVSQALKMKGAAQDAIRVRNSYRREAVEQLLSEGFTYREIGPFLGITGQMVGKLVKYWKQKEG